MCQINFHVQPRYYLIWKSCYGISKLTQLLLNISLLIPIAWKKFVSWITVFVVIPNTVMMLLHVISLLTLVYIAHKESFKIRLELTNFGAGLVLIIIIIIVIMPIEEEKYDYGSEEPDSHDTDLEEDNILIAYTSALIFLQFIFLCTRILVYKAAKARLTKRRYICHLLRCCRVAPRRVYPITNIGNRNETQLNDIHIRIRNFNEMSPNVTHGGFGNPVQGNAQPTNLNRSNIEQTNRNRTYIARAIQNRADIARASINRAIIERSKLDLANIKQANLNREKMERANQDLANIERTNPNQATIGPFNSNRKNIVSNNSNQDYIEPLNPNQTNIKPYDPDELYVEPHFDSGSTLGAEIWTNRYLEVEDGDRQYLEDPNPHRRNQHTQNPNLEHMCHHSKPEKY